MEEEMQIPFRQYFPNLSLGAYFWIVLFIFMVVFSVFGYFTGLRVDELSSSNPQTQSISFPQGSCPSALANTPGCDVETSVIFGYFVMNSPMYDQFDIYINGLPRSVNGMIDTDYRWVENPHVGIQYPYEFSRLLASSTYAVTAKACRVNPTTFALICAKNIKITRCTGQIQGETCVIKGNNQRLPETNEVDFSVPK
jgi:hypothetical protein